MSPFVSRAAVVAVLLGAGACADRSSPVEPRPPLPPPATTGTAGSGGPVSAQQATFERLARRLGLALRDDGFRGAVFAALRASRVREGKVHFQRFLAADQGRARRRLAELAAEPESAVASDLDQSPPIEMYLPVPAQRRGWRGDANLLVATAEKDHDVPVAFDTQGRRQLLDPETPPDTPVIAIGRAETDFRESTGPAGLQSLILDPNGGSTGGTAPGPGLYMTYASFNSTFEGWLKGSPEFEVHMLGQDGTSSTMKSYQCAGAEAGGPYYFDQNSTTWSGSVLLFSQTQLDAYKTQHPGQALRVFVVEDDDTACQIKTDSARVAKLLEQIQSTYGTFNAGKDTTFSLTKIWKKASSLLALFRSVWSFFTTQDDIVGDAIEDSVVGQYYPGANWIVKGENNVTNGAIRLEMR